MRPRLLQPPLPSLLLPPSNSTAAKPSAAAVGFRRCQNLLVREGKEMDSVLYTYRSCVKALPQNILYEIIAGLRNVSADAPSSSAAPRSISSTKSVGELLSDIAPVCNVNLSPFN
ncbi:uncharacterized protein LOC130990698 [Salvia miltiorrhiza]|uniref:uncharacterized protein LOC130990698 n=1 Tax=Salvia miltiorrhiza TaxID=226208 RepID=UPI0025ACE79F|nr:uncharacterized protein LOC130990698 [Salvia miltiorrhiza]